LFQHRINFNNTSNFFLHSFNVLGDNRHYSEETQLGVVSSAFRHPKLFGALGILCRNRRGTLMPTGSELAPLEFSQRLQEATINVRLEGAKEAIKRTRLAFLVSTIASLAILITVWNAYVSWDRRFPLLDKLPSNDVAKEVDTQFLHQYADSTAITVSLLGIRVGVSDLSVLGSLSLLVLSLWLFFSIRRENHTIAELLRDTKDDLAVIHQFVYFAISSFLVFTTLSPSDSPIDNLEETEVRKTYYLARWAIGFLFYLPALVLGFVIFMDFFSIYGLSSVASYPHNPLKREIGHGNQVKFWTMETCAAALGLATAVLCRKINRFQQATTKVLRDYLDRSKKAQKCPT
jgi:hypothetical protein